MCINYELDKGDKSIVVLRKIKPIKKSCNSCLWFYLNLEYCSFKCVILNLIKKCMTTRGQYNSYLSESPLSRYTSVLYLVSSNISSLLHRG